jgi:hypothetical protein
LVGIPTPDALLRWLALCRRQQKNRVTRSSSVTDTAFLIKLDLGLARLQVHPIDVLFQPNSLAL